ncbi:MAG: peptidoglycan DD-metalloendopeptidase family protein, partial [Rhizobiaceae bacterium]
MYRSPSNAAQPAQSSRRAVHANSWNAVFCLVGNGNTTTIRFSPLALVSSAFLALMMVLSLTGTSLYIAFQDDLVAAALARQNRMEQAYEDRIASLRTQVDLVTSRQLLDQQAIESRVAALAERQAVLGSRQKHVTQTIGANADSITTGSVEPAKPTFRKLKFGALIGSDNPFSERSSEVAALSFRETGTTSEVIDTLEASLERTEREQLAKLESMQKDARRKAKRLASILRKQGMRVPKETAVGGPLIEVDTTDRFASSVTALESSLETLEKVRRAAKSLPHGSPAPGSTVSSHFGSRKDPFTMRHAVHGGLDFRAKRGTPVLATASGTVIKAGRKGGYGKLVEIDHGGGITTRYAHLSRIKVRKGQKIKRGTVIGKVG